MESENRIFRTEHAAEWREAKGIFEALQGTAVFRGQGNAAYPLSTSLERRMLSKVRNRPPEQLLAIEHSLTKQFRRGAGIYYSNRTLPTNTLSWWAEMQHYGMPTRLLDFTWSPYVAAYFALEEGRREQDRTVWAVRMEGEHLQAIGQYDKLIDFLVEEFGSDVKKLVDSSDFWDDSALVDGFLARAQEKRLRAVVMVLPDRMNERMFSQQGLFAMPTSLDVPFMECLEESVIAKDAGEPTVIKIVLPHRCRLEGLTDLLRMNVTRASLFPGLDGFARSLADNYERALEAGIV